MKKRTLILIVCLILVGLFATTYNIMPTLADSGFDASFDSNSGSDGDGSGIFYLIYLCFEYPIIGIAVLIIIIILIYSNNKKGKEILNKAINSKLELLDITKYSKDKQLEIEAFNIYKQIQYAWMNFDEETIRKFTTDEMYNMYLMQMDTLKVKNQKNLMYDIKYLGSKIKSNKVINGQETIVIKMQVSCYDFIIDTKTNNVVRGSSIKLNNYTYELTFVKTVDNKKEDICPRCGAPVNGNNSGVCEYCNSTLISNNYTLVLSKKEMKKQS